MGVDLETILSSFSVLKMFWFAQILIFFGLFAFGKRYEKTNKNRDPNTPLGFFQFKKRPALLFFISFIFTSVFVWQAVRSYCSGTIPYEFVRNLLYVTAQPRAFTISSSGIIVGGLLFIFHLLRRFYECLYVSVFSNRQVYTISGVLLSYAYYLAAALSLIADGPPLTQRKGCFDIESFTLSQYMGVALYVVGSTIQYQTHVAFAKLRRNRAGHIVTSAYKIPKGKWFDVVSCPNYFGEILVYVSIALVLGINCPTWWHLTTYVIVNQMYFAKSTHFYYLTELKEYPRNRKMLFPMVF